MHNIALLHKQLLRFGAYCFNNRLCKQFLFVQSSNTFVEIDTGLNMSASPRVKAEALFNFDLTWETRHVSYATSEANELTLPGSDEVSEERVWTDLLSTSFGSSHSSSRELSGEGSGNSHDNNSCCSQMHVSPLFL